MCQDCIACTRYVLYHTWRKDCDRRIEWVVDLYDFAVTWCRNGASHTTMHLVECMKVDMNELVIVGRNRNKERYVFG